MPLPGGGGFALASSPSQIYRLRIGANAPLGDAQTRGAGFVDVVNCAIKPAKISNVDEPGLTAADLKF
jgi:hypothetical protein